MSFKKFKPEDLIFNIIKAHPQYTVHVYNGLVYINNDTQATGELGNAVKFASQGEISLHELNIDRDSGNKIYPFVTKDGARSAFKTISTSIFDDVTQYEYGDKIVGTYPLTASINRILVPAGTEHLPVLDPDPTAHVSAHTNKKYIMALRPTFESYRHLSSHYAYSSSLDFDKGYQEVNLICVPSIFYGSSIKRGSVNLSYYVTGTLAAQLSDKNANGELIQVSGSTTGDVAGVVLYREGIIALTGSWDIDTHTEVYTVDPETPKWLNFGTGMPYVGSGIAGTALNSSYEMTFEGTTSIPTMTMFAHASRGEYNYSNNPTFMQSGSGTPVFYSDSTFQESRGTIKNIVKSKYDNHSASFAKQTYISKIGIYDENENLIAIASLANPVKKTEDRNYTFKLKLDF